MLNTGTKPGNGSSARIRVDVLAICCSHLCANCKETVSDRNDKRVGFYWIRVWGYNLGSNGSSHGQLASTLELRETSLKTGQFLELISDNQIRKGNIDSRRELLDFFIKIQLMHSL